MDNERVYIDLIEKKSLSTMDFVRIKDIGHVFSNNKELKLDIESLIVYSSKEQEDWDYINTTQIARIISSNYPNIDIKFTGSSDVMLEIKSKEKKNIIFEFIKVTFVATTLFFGAALGIMYFHEDVNMSGTLEKLYFTFTGIEKKNPLIMNIPYSLGLGIGMLTFFNRIISSSKRRKMEPGPMDVELYLYDKDMEDFIIHDLKKHRSKEN